MVRIVVVDDHKLFRESLTGLLEREEDLKVVAGGGDGEEGLTLVRQYHPDLLLFDIRMPRVDGVRLAREMARLELKKIPSVAVTAYDDPNCLTALTSYGVLGFVLKRSSGEELMAAVRAALRGEAYVDPYMAGRMVRKSSPTDGLSPRERSVLYWLAQGESNAEVAQRMVLSEKTVKNHVSRLLKKMDLRDRSQAAAFAWRSGLAQTPPE